MPVASNPSGGVLIEAMLVLLNVARCSMGVQVIQK